MKKAQLARACLISQPRYYKIEAAESHSTAPFVRPVIVIHKKKENSVALEPSKDRTHRIQRFGCF
jgi:hypothetical protein